MSTNTSDPLETLALAAKNGEQIYYYDDDVRIPVILSHSNQSKEDSKEEDSEEDSEDSEEEGFIELVPDESLTHCEHLKDWTIKIDFI